MKKALHNLFGIVFILFCFCFLVAMSVWQYLIDHQIEDFPQKYERFFGEMFTLENFFWGLVTLFLMGFVSFFFWGAIVLIFIFLVRWPHGFTSEFSSIRESQLAFRSLFNTYTVIGFIMIYTWFLVTVINNRW